MTVCEKCKKVMKVSKIGMTIVKDKNKCYGADELQCPECKNKIYKCSQDYVEHNDIKDTIASEKGLVVELKD